MLRFLFADGLLAVADGLRAVADVVEGFALNLEAHNAWLDLRLDDEDDLGENPFELREWDWPKEIRYVPFDDTDHFPTFPAPAPSFIIGDVWPPHPRIGD